MTFADNPFLLHHLSFASNLAPDAAKPLITCSLLTHQILVRV
jgi:hypothetical protein